MFNNTVGSMHHISNDAIIPPLGPERSMEIGVGPVQYRTTYYNSTGSPITIVNRTGLRFTIPHSDNIINKGRFIIREEVSIGPEQWGAVDRLLNGIPNDSYALLQKFRDVWNSQRRSATRTISGYNARTVTFDYEITAQTLYENGSVYHRGCDLVVSSLDNQGAPPHPYHPDAAGAIGRFEDREDKDPTANVTLQLELIQGDVELAPRYLPISNRVFLVRPKRDDRREPGLYLTHLERDPLDPTRTRSVQEKYSIEEMESVLNMYRTQEEALSAGDLKAARREKLAELEHQTALLKQQYEAEKQARETQRLELEGQLRQKEHDNRLAQLAHERENSILKAENKALQDSLDRERTIQKNYYERRDMDREATAAEARHRYDAVAHYRKDYYDDRSHERKDRYDQRSTERKDSSEWMKFLPAVIVGIGAIVAACVKWFAD